MTQLKRWLAYALSFVPTPLPRGMTEFHRWSESILSTYNLPIKDDYKNALAAQIHHLGQSKTRIPKRLFAQAIIRSESNQIAYGFMQSMREDKKKLEVVGGHESEGTPEKVVQEVATRGLH